MSANLLDIDPDISRAWTLPAEVYCDPRYFELARERIFARSWQWVGEAASVRVPGQVHPFVFVEGILEEPLLLTRDAEDRLHCLSNVCTHRGNLVVPCPGTEQRQLRCRYHGRRFALDGRFLSMPEFEGAADFPSPADDLPRLPLEAWQSLLFTALDPAFPFAELVAELERRVGWISLAQCAFDPSRSRDYLVRANWALYVENYLEGFHIPYVHAALADALEYGEYATEVYPYSSLQLGVAKGGEDCFDLPPASPDHGRRIAGYYWWLFPNLMLNVYPWGLSMNVVKPLAPDRTKVSFLTFVGDPSRLEVGAGAALDRVEREDEEVVEAVQRGVRSRLYRRGRYSPGREQGVHHFHRLLARFLGEAPQASPRSS